MKEPLTLIGDLSSKHFSIVFDTDQTSVKLVMKDTETTDQRTLLRIAFHWRNKFQGIETPRLNVFEGDVVEELS